MDREGRARGELRRMMSGVIYKYRESDDAYKEYTCRDLQHAKKKVKYFYN